MATGLTADLTAVNSAKISASTGDTELTLDPAGEYLLQAESGSQDIYFSTDGSDVVTDTNTLVGQGILPKVGTTKGEPITIAGVAALKVKTAAASAAMTITRAGSFPATER